MAISIDGKNYLSVEEYKGKLKLVLGYINKDGDFKPYWCRNGYEQKENEKPQTLSITLGEKGDSTAIMQAALKEVIIAVEGRKRDDDDTPF